MTILIYTTFRSIPQKGGIECASVNVAGQLSEFFGVRCLSAYHKYVEGEDKVFDNAYQLSANKHTAQRQIKNIVRSEQVDVVLIQSDFRAFRLFKKALEDYPDTHLVFAHHFAPGWERLKPCDVRMKMQARRGISKLRYRLKLWLFPLFSSLNLMNMRKDYHYVCRHAERVVLLSDSYIRRFAAIAGIGNSNKLLAIPNAVTFNQWFDMNEYDNKEHHVIIVARLDERQKRIKLALQIWKQIKQDASLTDWTLDVIGDSDVSQVAYYRQWSKDNDIADVTFYGRRCPISYLQKARIFFMTSRSEGFPITLIEAKQECVVPLAFNTFPISKDIIHSGVDGFLIPEGDIQQYVDKAKSLMKDTQRCRQMAEKGQQDARRFSKVNVGSQWMKLAYELTSGTSFSEEDIPNFRKRHIAS